MNEIKLKINITMNISLDIFNTNKSYIINDFAKNFNVPSSSIKILNAINSNYQSTNIPISAQRGGSSLLGGSENISIDI